jgi:anti-sigma-K factor RskA|tara:strand:- start:194793 stop:195563 length:771 start_codon:yes stop_codon:yes gene_type:complete
MSEDAPLPLDGDDLVAAEFVLGLPDAAEMAQLAARRASDPAFARAVDLWEQRFAPLLDEAAPVDAPDDMWARIATELQGRRAANSDPGDVVTSPGKLRFWRLYGSAMTAAAAVLVAALLTERQTIPERPAVAPDASAPTESELTGIEPVTLESATLAPEEGVPVAVITYDAANKRLFVSPVGIPADADTVPQLWFIPGDGVPRSLGTIEAGQTVTLQLAEDFDDAATLAISIEPEGGSPTGAPTGPIVGTGSLSSL